MNSYKLRATREVVFIIAGLTGTAFFIIMLVSFVYFGYKQTFSESVIKLEATTSGEVRIVD